MLDVDVDSPEFLKALLERTVLALTRIAERPIGGEYIEGTPGAELQDVVLHARRVLRSINR